jgi:hypothetical protein
LPKWFSLYWNNLLELIYLKACLKIIIFSWYVRRSLPFVSRFSNRWLLNFNPIKTKIIIFNVNGVECNLTFNFDQTTIDSVHTHKHLIFNTWSMYSKTCPIPVCDKTNNSLTLVLSEQKILNETKNLLKQRSIAEIKTTRKWRKLFKKTRKIKN